MKISFSQIRGKDGFNDHPSPLDSIYRIRMIILGKNPGVVQKKVKTQENEESECIATNVFTRALSTLVKKPTIDYISADPMSSGITTPRRMYHQPRLLKIGRKKTV